jgi:predicted transcriptional regulator
MKIKLFTKRLLFRKRIYLVLFFIFVLVIMLRKPTALEEDVSEPLDLDRVKMDQILREFKTSSIVDRRTKNVDYVKMGDRLRTYKQIWKTVVESSTSENEETGSEMMVLLQKLETILFPWLHVKFVSSLELIDTYKGNGIVICSGNGQAKLTMATIEMIRSVHKSRVPIEIFYAGEDDLSKEWRQKMLEIPNTKVVDITRIFDNEIAGIKGWAIKPFAILASSFETVLLMDADVVFFQNPDNLLRSDFLLEHNTIFFRDRSLFECDKKTEKWFHDIMPKPPSSYSQTFRMFNGKTAHEQESGVVVVNKKKAFVGLLAASAFNVKSLRDHTYRRVFGDKETFWLGFEAVREHYQFFPHLPGNIGQSTDKNGKYRICSRQILHLDESGQPLWVNGGIQESKYEEDSPIANMREWIAEPGEWELVGGNMACLSSFRKPNPLNRDLTRIITSSGKILDFQ